MATGPSQDAGTSGTHRPLGRAVLGPAVVFALACGVFWASARLIVMPPAWWTFEFCQYAEIGRNLAEDGTFDTRLVEPMALALLDRDRVGPPSARWPVVDRYPLPCFVVAGLMRLLGTGPTAAAWSNGLAIGLIAATTYAAARRWFGEGWAAVAALLLLANPSFFGEFILLGTPDPWFAAFFLLELLAWSRLGPSADPKVRVGRAAALGGLGGLAYLARFNASVFLAVQAADLIRRRRYREAMAMAMAVAVVISPMLAYNWHHFRKPAVSVYSAWNLLDRIGAYRVEPWLYYRVPDLPRELASHAGGVARKFASNFFVTVPSNLWRLWRMEVVWPLALAGPWLARRGTGWRRFAGWSLGLFALQLALFSALRLEFEGRDSAFTGRYFFWFGAPAVLLGVGTLARLSADRRWVRRLAAVAVIGQLVIFGQAWHAITSWQPKSFGFGDDPVRRLLTKVVSDNRVVASNQPQVTAWACGLRSISLPADPDELARLNRESPTPADYQFIDMMYNCIDLDANWKRLIASDPRMASPWEPRLLRDYRYAVPAAITRRDGFVLLRRRTVPPGPLERLHGP